MKTYHFKCTLLSDVVLPARAATEGTVDSLDFIPGAKFMGIIASNYSDFAENTQKQLDLFHNGSVAFGNAYPYRAGQRYYPAPAQYFTRKGKKPTEEPLFLNHLIPPKTLDNMIAEGKQTKQVRGGYIDEAGNHYLTVSPNFELKSAYDTTQRRSADAQMFGYYGLPRGMVYVFTVSDFTGRYGAEIESRLVGNRSVGRSRSAQYGRVRIERIEEGPLNIPAGEVQTVYAAADLCFYDQYGHFKRPTATDLGVEGCIDWPRSQVRYRTYQSWNTHRWNRDADRWVVQRGSVFVLKEGATLSDNANGYVGSHYAEGFGRVLYDPGFLSATDGSYQRKIAVAPEEIHLPTPETGRTTDDQLLRLIAARRQRKKHRTQIDTWVNKFVREQGNRFGSEITKSQWGTVRNYAKHAANYDTLHTILFDENMGVLRRGQTEKLWRGKYGILLEELENIDKNDHREYLMKLAAQMGKRAADKNQTA